MLWYVTEEAGDPLVSLILPLLSRKPLRIFCHNISIPVVVQTSSGLRPIGYYTVL